MFLDVIMGRKQHIGLALSPQAVTVLDELAQQTDQSRIEVMEAIAHGRLAVNAVAPEWSFTLTRAGDHMTVMPASEVMAAASLPQSSVTPPSSVTSEFPTSQTPSTVHQASSSPPSSHTSSMMPDRPAAEGTQTAENTLSAADIAALKELSALQQTQLDAARSHIRQLQARLSNHLSTAALISAPSMTSERPAAETDITGRLQAELTTLQTAYAELAAAHQEQQSQNHHLRQQLATAQTMATIGESQLNRWRYKTFSC